MLQALQTAIEQARVFDLSQPMKQGMPSFFAHVPFSFSLNIRHADLKIPGGLGMANDIIVGSTHSGTHIDAVGHFSRNGCLHGGLDVRQVTTGPGGLLQHGIEQTAPILRRGVLFDVAAFKNQAALDPAYAITAQDLQMTAKAQGVELRSGDVALIRTGWAAYWDSPPRYLSMDKGTPGPDLSGAEWLVRNGASFTGDDTFAYEFNPGDGGGAVHAFLLVDHAVQIMENLNLEALAGERIYSFLFFASPLRIVGATASPIRPIAICS